LYSNNLTFIPLRTVHGASIQNRHLTNAPYLVRCGHLNAQYTHVEAQNYRPTHYLQIR